MRAFRRAATAWRAGKPHTAWEILAVAGYGEHWRQFQREAFRWARDRYTREMTAATRRR